MLRNRPFDINIRVGTYSKLWTTYRHSICEAISYAWEQALSHVKEDNAADPIHVTVKEVKYEDAVMF